MKLLLYTLSMLFMNTLLYAQAESNYEKLDDDEAGFVYKGSCTFADINALGNFRKSKADDYTPDTASMDILKKYLPGYKIICFLGTWCEDSQEHLPVLYKVLSEAGYPVQSVQLYAMDRDKKTMHGENDIYKIELVPTIILLKDDKEAGRIVESPRESIEKDLAAIVAP